MDPEFQSFGIGIPNSHWAVHSSLIPQGVTSSQQDYHPNVMHSKAGLRYTGWQYPFDPAA